MRINFIVAVFNELLLFALCHHFNGIILKEKQRSRASDEWKSYNVSKVMTMERARTKRENETAHKGEESERMRNRHSEMN